jgi:hypothetical protein
VAVADRHDAGRDERDQIEDAQQSSPHEPPDCQGHQADQKHGFEDAEKQGNDLENNACAASIPADDWFWGDLGQWLVCAGIVLGSLLFIAWLFPRFGGIALVIVGGLAAISGLTLTIQAGFVFGAAPLVSGLLFVWAESRSAVADDCVRGARGTNATLRADRPN